VRLLTICAFLFVASAVQAAPRWLFRASQAALVASGAFAISTSWGGGESNPIMRSRDGRFGTRGLALSIGIRGGWLAGSEIAMRKRPSLQRAVTWTNLGMAGIGCIDGGRNLRSAVR
jgi:hypothetical protein